MKSVSLNNVQDYCKDLTEKDLEIYNEKEDEYRKMWSSQSIGFWVKLVISLRKYIVNNSSKYDEKCEKEFIAFLKSLTFKTFVELNNYIKNAFKNITEHKKLSQELKLVNQQPMTDEVKSKISQLRVLTLKLKCAGTFINILPAWNLAPVGSDFSYVPPESWFIPALILNPFEGYIRSKWGGYQNIEEILGCKRENLGWWKAAAQKGSETKVTMNLKVPKGTQEETIVQCWSPPEGYQLYGLENPIPESTEETSSTVTTSWLPSERFLWQIFEDYNDMKMKHVEFIWKMDPLFKLWPLMEHSFPPVLNKKYHIINVTELMKGDNVKHYLGVATWFIQFVAGFGNRYMNFIKHGSENLVSRSAIPDPTLQKFIMEEWLQIRENDKLALETIMNKSGAPDEPRDCVATSSEFLLEPCILIQLPWQPVLLRQWLAMALIEVLKFEKESIELKHWPLSKEIEPIARELLSLVRDTKDKIILGWMILSFEASTYPEVDDKHPDFILDNIVIPSLNTLELLSSGKANEIIQSLKKLSFSESNQSLSEKVNVHRSALYSSNVISKMYVVPFVHHYFWKPYAKKRLPFPTVDLEEEDDGLEYQYNELQNNREPVSPPENKPIYLHRLSIEEIFILKTLKEAAQDLPQLYTTKSILNRIETILKEVIIKCGHFSKEKLDMLLTILQTDDAKQTIENIFKIDYEKDELTPLQHLVLACMVYHDVNRYLATIFGQSSIMAWLVRLSAQVTEREQLIRVIAACAVLTEECPKICGNEVGKCPAECNVNVESPMEKATMMRLITDVRENDKNLDRDSLWSKFPQEWKKNVDLNFVMPTMENGIPAIVAALESRVGRIVWNVAQQNFNIHKRGFEIFRHSQIVQYLLPCYISILVDASKHSESERNTAKIENLIKFLNGLVNYYEKSYYGWLQEAPVRNNDDSPIPKFNPIKMKISRTSATYYLEATSNALHGFIGLGRLGKNSDLMPHFSIIAKNILEYPLLDAFELSSKIEVFNCITWLKFMFPHTKALRDTCYRSIPIPSPTAHLSTPELEELYLASAIMHQLEAICSIQECFNLQLIGPGTPDYEKLIEISEKLRIWRYILFCIVFEVDRKFNYPENMLETFINGEGQYLMLQMLNIIQTIRTKIQSRINEIIIPTYDLPVLKQYIDLFYSNRLNNLNLFKHVVTGKVIEAQSQLVICSNCKDVETEEGMFEACEACKEQNYPEIHYFCSQDCKESNWNSGGHSEQHLQFLLGLCDSLDQGALG